MNIFPESWGSRNPHWFNIFYLGFCHLWGLYALFCVVPNSRWETIAFGWIFLHMFYGMGITVGCHRLWTHRSFKANLPLRYLLMLMASGANQGSIYHWVLDHRVHHKYSDTDGDPHNSQNGFWYSHIGWLLVKKSPSVIQAGRSLGMRDIHNDQVVMFQKEWYSYMGIIFCFLYPTVLMCYLFNETVWNSLGIAFLRYCTLLNATWCVNSVAHFYGARPYKPNIPPAENTFVSVIAGGEGYHNYHHSYPKDYATSEYGILKQWNPSKLFIDCFAMIGWVWDRRIQVKVPE